MVMVMAFLLNDVLSDSRLSRVRLRRVARLGWVGLIGHHYYFLHSLVMVMSAHFLNDYSAGLGRVGRWVALRGISWLSHDDFLHARMMMVPTNFFNYDSSRLRRVRLSIPRLGIGLRIWLRRVGLRRVAWLLVARLNILLWRVWLRWVGLRSTRHCEIHVNFSGRSASIMQRNPLLKEPSLEHMEVEVSLCDELISPTTVPVVYQEANTLFPVPH